MRFGAHLPQIDFGDDSWQPGDLDSYADAARELGFSALSANDHLVFQKPWLDGIVALSSVINRTGEMTLATTVSLPVLRNPVALAKHAVAIDILSGGRLVLGVGPGSSARDYEVMGLDFEQRWKRLDEAISVLRCHMQEDAPAYEGAFYSSSIALAPRPTRPRGPDIWVGSWGSDAGLRRAARLGDGWLASAYNTTPQEMQTGRANLNQELQRRGRDPASFPSALATMWTYITDDRSQRASKLEQLGRMLNRPPGGLGDQVIVGTAEEAGAKLRAYAAAGVDLVFIWPLADGTQQLERFTREVAPLVNAV